MVPPPPTSPPPATPPSASQGTSLTGRPVLAVLLLIAASIAARGAVVSWGSVALAAVPYSAITTSVQCLRESAAAIRQLPSPGPPARAATVAPSSSTSTRLRQPPAGAINLAIVSGGWQVYHEQRHLLCATDASKCTSHGPAATELKGLVYTALLSTGAAAPIHFIFITDDFGESVIRTWFEGCDAFNMTSNKFTPPTYEVVIVSGSVVAFV